LPVEIGQLTNLATLNLNRNQLSGTLPNELSKMYSLNTLDVSSNVFSGAVPVSINNLSNLFILDLHNNQFDVLPNLSEGSLNNLQLFSVQENYFQFNDIEPNMNISSSFQYAPQFDVNEEISINISETASATFSVTIDGNALNYKWLRNNEIPRFANNGVQYSITDADFIDGGTYICYVSSDNVPGLIIKRKAVNVVINTLDVIEAERNVLIEFYHATDGPNWLTDNNWNTNEPVYKWYGVTVLRGKIIKIELPENNLKGYIPASIEKLQYLTELNLQTNGISGIIPPEICNLLNLNLLNLRNNQFSGNIPSNIGNLTHLMNLHLSINSLEGEIPASINNLVNLNVLDLRVNQLTGNIPSLTNLINLNYLFLETNELTGNLPDGITNMLNLIELNLSANHISGEIPANIGQLKNLTRLTLNNNIISGSIPKEIGDLPQLIVLNLSSNLLSGNIPAELGKLNKLNTLQLSDNELIGNIPLELSALTNLRILSVFDNQMSGVIKSNLFSNWLKLEDFLINNNQFTGTIPSEIGSLSNLKRIRLNDNYFDSLPDISKLKQLEELFTQNNYFTFNDLIPYFDKIGFQYSPQRTKNFEIIYISKGGNYTLEVINDAQKYVWKKDEVLTTEESNEFSISNATIAHFGYYKSTATHSLLPLLTLNYVFSVVVNDMPNVEKPDNYCIGDNAITLRDNNNSPSKTFWYWTINGEIQRATGQVYRFELPENKATLRIVVRYAADSLISKEATII